MNHQDPVITYNMYRPRCVSFAHNQSSRCWFKKAHFTTQSKAPPTIKFDGLKEPVWSVSLFLKDTHKSDQQITSDRLKHLCQISRLALDEKNSEQIKQDLGTILNFVGHVQDADTEGVKPLHSVIEKYVTQEELFKLSQSTKHNIENELQDTPILNNAKVTFRSHFAVPKVKET